MLKFTATLLKTMKHTYNIDAQLEFDSSNMAAKVIFVAKRNKGVFIEK